MVQESIHRYAEEVMRRPIGVKLDRMTPEEAIAPESPVLAGKGEVRRTRVSGVGTRC